MSLPANCNIKLILAYDGTRYCGWQKTKEGPSIEETLESVLQQILQTPVKLQAASRTDAGVHALSQVVNFFSPKPMSLEKLQLSANALLPKDITILKSEIAPYDFHPTLHCRYKEYHYSICHGPTQLPQNRLYSWHHPRALNIPLMQEAARLLIGQQDFSCFCNDIKRKDYPDHIRTVHSLEIKETSPSTLSIIIQGNNFLFRMARNIAGTLVYIGNGKIGIDQLPKILLSKDRKLAGVTAPAHGLCLQNVYY